MWQSGESSNYVHPASSKTEAGHDDSNRTLIRNSDTWGGALSVWFLHIRQHSEAAVELINERNGRRLNWAGNEVKVLLVDTEQSVITRVIPDEVKQVILSPFTNSTEHINTRVTRALNALSRLDLQYDVLQDNGFPCKKSVGAHLVQHLLDIATLVDKLKPHLYLRLKPIFGCNRRIPFAEAVAMEMMVKDHYSSPQRWDEHRDELRDDDRSLVGQTTKLVVDPKIEGTDLPVKMSMRVAESVLARLKLEVRHRLGKNLLGLEERAKEVIMAEGLEDED
jgi:hypothetical protein